MLKLFAGNNNHNHQKRKSDLRVIFVFKNFSKIVGGNVYVMGLGIATRNTSMSLADYGIETDMWGITDEKDLEQKIEDDIAAGNKPVSHIIVSAPWISTATFAKLAHKHKTIKFVDNFHSNLGFLYADSGASKLLGEYIALQSAIPNFHISGNSTRFADWASITYDTNVLFLPNLYYVNDMKPAHYREHNKEPLKIGMFGATRIPKNLLTQAGAAAAMCNMLGVDGELWLSTGRTEGGMGVLNNMRRLLGHLKYFKIKELSWRPWEQFRHEVGKMDINFQVSYTESFNVVAADSLWSSGTPVVVSSAINWVPKNWRADEDDAIAIAKKGIELLNDKKAPKEGQKALIKYVDDGIEAWLNFLLRK